MSFQLAIFRVLLKEVTAAESTAADYGNEILGRQIPLI